MAEVRAGLLEGIRPRSIEVSSQFRSHINVLISEFEGCEKKVLKNK